MEGRSRVFQRLKPPCVALSQAALALNGPSANLHLVADRLDGLKKELSDITSKPYALDEKLADYVFFPLSQVLKASQRVSIRCLELAFQCLAVLIEQGWRARIQDQLSAQILILCTLMAEKRPKGIVFTDSTDDLRTSALWCLYHLFIAVSHAPQNRSNLTSEANFPQLGQTIATILDAILECESAGGQIAAVKALQILVKATISRQAQAAFLPGISSKLTKVLTPQTDQRRNHKVLIDSLDVLSTLFINTLSNHSMPSIDSDPGIASVTFAIDDKWLEAAATQLKPALSSIVRLKDHGRFDVREAVAQLCLTILKNCRKALEKCVPIALETILLLASNDGGEAIKFRIEALVAAESAVSTLAQSTLHSWLQSLTTEMQAADDYVKVQRTQQLCIAYEIIANSSGVAPTIDRLASSVMRDSTAILFGSPQAKQRGNTITPVQSLDVPLYGRLQKNVEFDTALASTRGGQQVMDAIQQLLETIQASSTSVTADLARSLHQTQDDMQLATFWLLLLATETALRTENQVDALLNFGVSPTAYTDYLDELYSFSLGILTKELNSSRDPRFTILALRTLALRARQAGADFRFELIDVLYPVLHTLATPEEQIQQDSITTLNIFTKACGYGSVQELIVENVDYLTNAVALKLNAFDVSPQAPQVLLMMVRLAGPSLLPYLEDTIESIFAALEDYHGYPLLVELLFRVLSVVAEEGTKGPQLAITRGDTAKLQQALFAGQNTTIMSLASDLREQAANDVAPCTNRTLESHPAQPWKYTEKAARDDDDDDDAASSEAGSDYQDNPVDEVELPPPVPKTYNILLKISELTQHFLPSASTSLRSSLLTLIKTTIPAIARHQNSFLPLVNTLWPEIVSRLDDPEPQIVATALEVLALICEFAGDFMRGRILQLWPHLVEVWQKTTYNIIQSGSAGVLSDKAVKAEALAVDGARLRQAVRRMRSSLADYSDTVARLLWNSLVNAIMAAVQYVGLPPGVFDEALEMMESTLEDDEVRRVFERENADAVWLIQTRGNVVPLPGTPICPPEFCGSSPFASS